MESMFGIDLFPRLTASILTVAMVMGGGLLVLRRRRTDDRFTLRAWLGLEMDSYLPCKDKASKSSNQIAEVLISDYMATKLDPNIHDLIEKVSKKEINNQQAAAMLDLLKKSEPNQRKKRHCNGVVKKKEKVKQETEALRDDKKETQVATKTDKGNIPEQKINPIVAANGVKHSEQDVRRLQATVTALEKENEEMKQTVTKLLKSEESWKEQVKALYIQLGAMSKYAAKLKWVLQKSKKPSKAEPSIDTNKFQCQIETHYDMQKVNITSS